MTDPETFVLAGFVAGPRWVPPVADWTAGLPRAIATVSDCLTDFLPTGPEFEEWQQPLFEPWQLSLRHATDAVRRVPHPAHVLSMSVAPAQVTELTALMEQWIDDLPHPVRLHLAQPAPTPPGIVLGFEVLGFDVGRFHSWLCHGTEGYDERGIRPGKAGLLTTLHDAQQVVELLSTDQDDTTWFPALITEHDTDRGAVETST
ncbi:hypothetical protein GCM10010435_29680 [Winogradskya consettensis]|uniref:Uncharacterized protein n=1 Tax=Winogradskya consettensis TaxID=113560 RepID=A0A919VLL6_9ACTN|nr:hypothetical protein [Actinoplanes consettensis]GIM70734.1 hypothetical protein Aco04nite_21820 [Actinoplanes consettensis]